MELQKFSKSWRRHQMETVSTLLALCTGNSTVTGEFPSQKPVTRSFDVFFDLRLNKAWANNWDAGDLRCHRAHYDVNVMICVASDVAVDVQSIITKCKPQYNVVNPDRYLYGSRTFYFVAVCQQLTHLSLYRMAAILQKAFLNAFSWKCSNLHFSNGVVQTTRICLA